MNRRMNVNGPALDDPAYQVRAIRIGRALVADRVLLKNISWEDLHVQEICCPRPARIE